MKTALVIHPRFFVYGGGELLSLYVQQTLQESGYRVLLACDVYDPEAVERVYGMGSVMRKSEHIGLPSFKPKFARLLAFQRLFYARRIKNYLNQYKADIVFSTQSSLFNIINVPLYHFIYDIVDLFAYPGPLLAGVDPPLGGKGLHWRIYYQALKWIRQRVLGTSPEPAQFFALSTKILQDLKRNGYDNSELLYPPCRIDKFKPQRKRDLVIQVTRLVPQKRLDWFMQIAKALPEYDFILVGRDTPILQKLNPGYTRRLMESKPSNVTYIESPIQAVPKLLEESRVYLYTGVEPGIGIALVEAIGAGCVPVTPREGGGGEVVRATYGYQFDTVNEAVSKVRRAMLDPVDPETMAEKAKVFSPGMFQARVRKLL